MNTRKDPLVPLLAGRKPNTNLCVQPTEGASREPCKDMTFLERTPR